MAGKQTQVKAAAERITELVLDAVTETLAQRSPEPGRRYLTGLSGGRTDEERATELMVTLILVRWLSVVRDHVPVDDAAADHVEPVLAWIEAVLGPRYAARARYTSAPLVGEESAADIMSYRDALRGDFLPSLLWQLAAMVALHGEGDPDWLRDLVGRADPVG